MRALVPTDRAVRGLQAAGSNDRSRRTSCRRRALSRRASATPIGLTSTLGIPLALATWVTSAAQAAGPTLPGTLENPLREPEACRECHQFPTAAHMDAEPRYDPYSWLPSMMSNAARDPVFWAGVAIAAQDSPGGTEACVRCHSPRGFLAGQGHVTTLEALDPEFRDGISCETCHRMIEDASVPPGNGAYVIDDGEGGIVPMRGPWDYATDGLQPPHAVVQSDFLGRSRLCGTCHDVSTERERVDEAGQSLGTPFNEQRTYSEWLRSAYAEPGGEVFASCQDCHMPAVDNVAGCLVFSKIGQRHATGARRHDLVGANRFMLTILRDLYGWQGEDLIPDPMFDHAIERTEELLRSAAKLDVQYPEQVDLREGLHGLTVAVTNLTGHKLPTGYSEGRVMWLEVTAHYGDTLVYASGRWDPGNAAFTDGIEGDAQIRRYEAIAEDADDGTRLHLLRNNRWIVDSRIPPKGLVPHIDTDPVGNRYALLGGGTHWPHTDTAAYNFDALPVEDATPDDPRDDRLTINVRLLLLINTSTYLSFLRDENHSNAAGETVFQLFEERAGATPVVLAEDSAIIALGGLALPGDDTEDTAGSPTDTATDTGATPDTSSSESSSGPATADGPLPGGSPADTSETAQESGAGALPATEPDSCSCRSSKSPADLFFLVAAASIGRLRRKPRRNPPNPSKRTIR
ncbi:MAG: multiheme c-type cytochrome [Nannocystaceae bacterium]